MGRRRRLRRFLPDPAPALESLARLTRGPEGSLVTRPGWRLRRSRHLRPGGAALRGELLGRVRATPTREWSEPMSAVIYIKHFIQTQSQILLRNIYAYDEQNTLSVHI